MHGITSEDVSDAPSLLKALRKVDAGRILKGGLLESTMLTMTYGCCASPLIQDGGIGTYK